MDTAARSLARRPYDIKNDSGIATPGSGQSAGTARSARLALDGPGDSASKYLTHPSSTGGSAAIRLTRRCSDTSCADHSRKHPDGCISVDGPASEPTDRGKPIRAPGRPILLDRLPVDSPAGGELVVETERQILRPAPVPQLLSAVRERMPNPVRFGLYLVLASTPLLAISGEVFGIVSLRAVSTLFLFPLLGILAVVVIVKPAGIDRTALAGFAWGVAACAGYDLFRLPNVYVFHLWGDFFGRIGGWATGTSSNYLTGYLWRYLGDGAGIGVVVFLQAAVIGVSSWPRRRVVGYTVAFAVCPVWAGLVLTDWLAPAGRALFPLNATTLALSLAGHLIYGAILGYGLWAWQNHTRRDVPRAAEISSGASLPSRLAETTRPTTPASLTQ